MHRPILPSHQPSVCSIRDTPRIPGVTSVFAMAEEGDVELGFTPAQQEWIRRLVESQRDTKAQDLSSSAETTTTSSPPQTSTAGNLGKSLFAF